jgi:hypothetical protein
MQSSGRRRLCRRPRLTGVLSLTVMLATQSGCYTYAPAAREITPGQQVAYTLNDRGRVAVADQIGSGVLRVEGTLLQSSGSAYALAVSRVRTLDGRVSRWGGERVTVGHEHVASSFERRFSKPRTVLAVGAAVVGVTAFALTRSLFASGFGFGDRDGGTPPVNQ